MKVDPVRKSSHQVQQIAMLAGVLIVLIVVLQNVDTINIEFLFFDFNLPLALLLIATLLIGMAVGVWLGLRHRNRASR